MWTDHGQLPVPAFATMRLLVGMKTCKGPGEWNGTVTGELVTPTAAALLRVLSGVADFEKAKKVGKSKTIGMSVRVGRAPAFTPRAIGIGAGTKDFKKHPNIMRLILGDEPIFDEGKIKTVLPGIPLATKSSLKSNEASHETSESVSPKADDDTPTKLIKKEISTASHWEHSMENENAMPWNTDMLTLLQANIDDITPEVLAHVLDLLLKNGAIDAWLEPIVMKKGRSAHTLNCLFHSSATTSPQEGDEGAVFSNLMKIIFRHTTTLGVRIQRNIERAALRRKMIQVQTIYGVGDEAARNGCVDVKLGFLGDEVVSVKAEFDHCHLISERTGVPVMNIAQYASVKAKEQLTLLK